MTLIEHTRLLYAMRAARHPGVVPWEKLTAIGQDYWQGIFTDAAEVLLSTLTPSPAMADTFRQAYYNNTGGAGDDPIALALEVLFASPVMAEALLPQRATETAGAA